jgi:hypothetical protein
MAHQTPVSVEASDLVSVIWKCLSSRSSYMSAASSTFDYIIVGAEGQRRVCLSAHASRRGQGLDVVTATQAMIQAAVDRRAMLHPEQCCDQCLSWVIRDWVETTADQAISGIPRLRPVLAMQPKIVMCQMRNNAQHSRQRTSIFRPHALQ